MRHQIKWVRLQPTAGSLSPAMAIAINIVDVIQRCGPRLQKTLQDLTGDLNRFLIYRICLHAIVFHVPFSLSGGEWQGVARQEALDWQADQDDDLDEVEVFHHLKQQAQTSPWLAAASTQTEHTNASTTLVASCALQSPSLIECAQRRPLSSFRRYSSRFSGLFDTNSSGYGRCSQHSVPNLQERFLWPIRSGGQSLRIVGASSDRCEPWVAWQVQIDIVDLLSRRSTSTWRHEKRRRSTLNPFHRVSSSQPVEDTPRANRLPEAKQFNGVRYRSERRTWTAEMKPPKSKKKEYFGEFKSQTQAARVVDVAYYYYGKPSFLNFPDTPHLLSTMPLPEGLGVEDMLRFVKEQAKWVSTIASSLPSSPAFVTAAIPHQSSRGCQAGNFMFGSMSDVASFLSCGDAHEADDGISQSQPSLQLDSMASNGLMEPNLVTAEAGGFINGVLQEQQGGLQWSSEDDFGTWCPPSSSVHITDGAEHSTARALT